MFADESEVASLHNASTHYWRGIGHSNPLKLVLYPSLPPPPAAADLRTFLSA